MHLMTSITFSQLLHNPEERRSNFGARANAFAGAYTTETHDVSSMYWNPAATAYLENSSVLWDYYMDWDAKMRQELIAVPFLPTFNSVLSIGATASQFRFTDEFDAVYNTLSYGIDAAFAIRVIPTFSIGVFGSGKQATLGNEALTVFTSSIGLLYKPGPEVSYGITYNGVGNIFETVLENGMPALKKTRAPKNLQIGLTLNFPSSKSQRDVTLAIANDKTFGERGVRYNGALEWCVTRFFDLRIGYVVAPGYGGTKYGAGINFGGVKADYAISPSKITNRFQEFTFSFDL